MKKRRPGGVLVLFCRSSSVDDFSWYKKHFSKKLQARFEDRIRFVDVFTASELVTALTTPSALFDISEVHVLIEFNSGYFWVDALAGEMIAADNFDPIQDAAEPGLQGGELLPEASVRFWYMSSAGSPNIDLLNRWSEHFGRRFLFLPLTQLKRLVRPKPASNQARPSGSYSTSGHAGYINPEPASSRLNLAKFIMLIAVIGGFAHFLSEQARVSGKYEQRVKYEDSVAMIDSLTLSLESDDGKLVEHSWIFGRTRWDFTFFIAQQWLDRSERELARTVRSRGQGDRYWGNVYRKIIRFNDHRLDNVASALEAQALEMELDDFQLANFVLSFVQHIPYRIPGNRLGLLAPPQTLKEIYGDCDSKSLLYVLILRKLGYETVMFVNNRIRHAMAGVSTNATGKYLSSQGIRYYFAETTGVGYRIGQLNTRPEDWYLVRL